MSLHRGHAGDYYFFFLPLPLALGFGDAVFAAFGLAFAIRSPSGSSVALSCLTVG